MPVLKHYDIVSNYTITHLLLSDVHGIIIKALYDKRKEKPLFS